MIDPCVIDSHVATSLLILACFPPGLWQVTKWVWWVVRKVEVRVK